MPTVGDIQARRVVWVLTWFRATAAAALKASAILTQHDIMAVSAQAKSGQRPHNTTMLFQISFITMLAVVLQIVMMIIGTMEHLLAKSQARRNAQSD